MEFTFESKRDVSMDITVKINLTISDFEFKNAGLDKVDKRFFEEYMKMKSDKVSDQLLGLKSIVKKIEEANDRLEKVGKRIGKINRRIRGRLIGKNRRLFRSGKK